MSKMMKGEKQALMPRLRFPEFRDSGEWEEATLGKCLSRRPEYGINAPSVPYADNLPTYLRITDISDEGYIRQDQKVSVAKNVTDENYLEDGDIVLARTGASVGKAYKYRVQDGRLVFAGFLIRVRPHKERLNPEFLFQFLSTERYWRWVAFSSARSGQPGINGNEYASLPIPMPPSQLEQQKIADCLSSLDGMIAAQADKIEALRTHKKGLMQQLFPREGKTAPRLRFPEFRGAGEWNEAKLSTQIELISGLHLAPSAYADAGDIPYFTGPSDYTNNSALVNKWTDRSANVARDGDTLVTVKGSGVGELLLLHLSEVAMGRQLMAVRAKAAHGQFIYHVLSMKRQQMIALASGNLIPGLSRGDILGLGISVPDFKEQQRIADCLSSLDGLIAAHSGKLDALKTHKKGLIQQIFPVVEGVA